MALTIDCQCGKRLEVSPEYAGKRGRCPNCGTEFRIPPASIQVVAPSPTKIADSPRSEHLRRLRFRSVPISDIQRYTTQGILGDNNVTVTKYKLDDTRNHEVSVSTFEHYFALSRLMGTVGFGILFAMGILLFIGAPAMLLFPSIEPLVLPIIPAVSFPLAYWFSADMGDSAAMEKQAFKDRGASKVELPLGLFCCRVESWWTFLGSLDKLVVEAVRLSAKRGHKTLIELELPSERSALLFLRDLAIPMTEPSKLVPGITVFYRLYPAGCKRCILFLFGTLSEADCQRIQKKALEAGLEVTSHRI